MIIKNDLLDVYFIVLDSNGGVLTHGVTPIGSETSFMQPDYIIFETEQEYLNKLTELNINIE